MTPHQAKPTTEGCTAGRRSDQAPPINDRACGADYKIVKVAAHLEPTGLFDPADLHRLEAGRSDQPLNFLASTVVVGRVEEDRQLR